MPSTSVARRSFRSFAILGLLSLAACNGAPNLGYYGTGYDPTDLPGTPRTPVQISRRLLEDGYRLRTPPKQAGAVYFVDVTTPRGQPECLVLHAFSGVILQRFSIGRHGLVPEIRHTPGPGFPGYPPVPEAHEAELCQLAIQVVEQDPLIIPGIGPDPLRVRY